MYEKFIQTKHLAVNFIQKFAHKYDLTSYYANIIVRLILQNHRPGRNYCFLSSCVLSFLVRQRHRKSNRSLPEKILPYPCIAQILFINRESIPCSYSISPRVRLRSNRSIFNKSWLGEIRLHSRIWSRNLTPLLR